MIFWEILISILLLITLPYKKSSGVINGEMVYIIQVKFMPWASGMCIGRLIFTSHDTKFLSTARGEAFLIHEVAHVKQWRRHGWKFPFIYIKASLDAILRRERAYSDNKFEIEAYQEEYEYKRKHKIGYVDRYKE